MSTSTLTRTDARLAEALRLADEGRHVFLLGRSKRPVANCRDCHQAGPEHDREACPCLTCHGFFSGTRDPDRIRTMITTVPGGMLAIRTGAPSGVVVLDVDPRNGGDAAGLIRRYQLPHTAWVRTGSGGYHFYLRHPGGYLPCSQSRIAPGVDVRGDAGYAVLPPSVHPRTGHPYVWVQREPAEEMPPALVTACQPAPAAPVTTPAGPTPTTPTGGIRHPERLLATLIDRIDNAPEGRRRTTLYGVARGVARMVAAGAITASDAWAVLAAAGRRAQQTDRQIREAIEGGFTAEGVRL